MLIENFIQAFPTNTSIVSNVCNVTLPISSTSARIAEMIRADSLLTSQFGAKSKRKTNKTNVSRELVANFQF